MQIAMEIPTKPPTLTQAEAQCVAREYVTTQIDPRLRLSDRASYRHIDDTWLFVVRSEHGALHSIQVKAQTGKVVPLTEAQIRLVRERAAIAMARSRHVLPVDQQGYVLAEYARRKASEYLDVHLSMFFTATEPLFIPSNPPIWQLTILFKMYNIGPFTLGIMDVDARTGEPMSLTDEELTRIRERTSAIIRSQTPTTEPS
ncbi:MAG: hypothetical protein U0350_44755 [Caldilineaceae bacterium]